MIMTKKQGVIIYGENWCKFCKASKKHLQQHKIKYKFIQGKSGREIQQLLKSKKKVLTIPQIVIDGKHIGGYSDLKKFKFL